MWLFSFKDSNRILKEFEKSIYHDINKGHSNFLETKYKEMKICDLPDEEFKIAVLRKLSELQENRKTVQWNLGNRKQNEKLNKEVLIEIIRKKEILELNAVNKVKKCDKSSSRLDQAEGLWGRGQDIWNYAVSREQRKENEKEWRKFMWIVGCHQEDYYRQY